ncbi:MAG: malic enzyme-like NAD(P)-binding protein [Candidatus Anstonellales archaeon]
MELKEEALNIHKKLKGKIEIKTKANMKTQEMLKLLYTPGVAEISKEIMKNKDSIYDYTWKSSVIAILSNGTRLLGLGNAGPYAALPVMEGKAALFKSYANVDAVPLCVDLYSLEELEAFAKAIQPCFGGINLEDIQTDIAFFLYERLSNELDIPVFHDDRHGTGIVVLAALINAFKLTNKGKEAKITIYGAGSAALGIAEILNAYGMKNLVIYDSKGQITEKRQDIKGTYKEVFLQLIGEEENEKSDVLIATSGPGSIDEKMLKNMANDPIIFTLSNPEPDIAYNIAKKYSNIVATGRSDMPNQVNNVLAFPGFFKALLKYRIKKVKKDMQIKAAEAIAKSVSHLSYDSILPRPFDKNVIKNILKALKTF